MDKATRQKRVEVIKRNMPFSKEKEERRATALFWKIELRSIKAKNADNKFKTKRRREAGIIEMQSMLIDGILQELENEKV